MSHYRGDVIVFEDSCNFEVCHTEAHVPHSVGDRRYGSSSSSWQTERGEVNMFIL